MSDRSQSFTLLVTHLFTCSLTTTYPVTEFSTGHSHSHSHTHLATSGVKCLGTKRRRRNVRGQVFEIRTETSKYELLVALNSPIDTLTTLNVSHIQPNPVVVPHSPDLVSTPLSAKIFQWKKSSIPRDYTR